MTLPDLHDGYFDGIWVSDNKDARLFVRTPGSEKLTIVLTGVEALNINDVRQGNIIFDVVVATVESLSAQQVCLAYGLDDQDNSQSSKLWNQAKTKGLSALEISTSYGAQGAALFMAGSTVTGHIL